MSLKGSDSLKSKYKERKMQEECAAEVAEMHIFIRRYMIRGDWRQIYPSRRILHNPLHQNWEKKREQ